MGIRSLTGAPVYNYNPTQINSTFWNVLSSAFANNYIIGSHSSIYYSGYNICNITNNFAYSVLQVFNLTLANGTVIKATMFRNPQEFVYYNQSLSANDPVWTSSSILSQVPLGVNPVTDGVKYGIFIVPSNLLSTCF